MIEASSPVTNDKRICRYSRLIITPEERATSEIPHHHNTAPGKRRVFLEKKLLPEAEAYVMVRSASVVQQDQPLYIDRHAHKVASIYLFLGNQEDLNDLSAEITLADETFIVESPATVYIPPGIFHHSRLIHGSGHFAHIVLNGDYTNSLYP